ncbi:hypothetical protein LCGC14_2446510, partial [marine sediment metagenome]
MAKAKCVEYDKTGKCVKFRLEHGEM